MTQRLRPVRVIGLLLLSVLFVVVPARAAHAASISITLLVANTVCPQRTGGLVTAPSGLDHGLEAETTDVGAGVTAAATCSRGEGLPVYSLAATAIFDNALSLGASVEMTIPAPGDYTSDAYASAAFADVVTVTGGTAGTAGFLGFNFLVEGSTNATQDRRGNTGATVTARTSSGGSFFSDDIRGTQSLSFALPVVFGAPTGISLSLDTYLHQVDDINRTETLFADFLNTAHLLSVDVLDANRLSIAGGAVTSSSGLDYTGSPSPAPVPEPATLSLFGLGLGVVGTSARRRFKRR